MIEVVGGNVIDFPGQDSVLRLPNIADKSAQLFAHGGKPHRHRERVGRRRDGDAMPVVPSEFGTVTSQRRVARTIGAKQIYR